jgi:hypothetical protein
LADYRKNSDKARKETEEKKSSGKKVERVTKGAVKAKKKSGFRKLMDAFVQEEIGTVKTYIWNDVLVPAVKKTFSDTVTNALDMFLWGKGGGGRRPRGNAERISYRSYYDRPSSGSRESERRRSYDYDDVILDSREEAEEVLARMDELLTDYKMVSVADFYDLVGITGKTTDNRYGWTDLRNASVVRDRDGYLIKLPRAEALE